MTVVLFVRHGQTVNNVRHVLSSAAPGPGLTPEGRHQVARAAQDVAEWSPEVVYTSPLLRARQTARLMASPRGLQPVVTPGLVECGVGALEGRGDSDAFAVYQATWDQWLRGRGLDRVLGPGGETGAQCLERLRATLHDVCAAHPRSVVVLTGHAGLMHFGLTLLAQNLDASWTATRPVPNGGLIILRVEDGDMTCVDWCGEGVPDL